MSINYNITENDLMVYHEYNLEKSSVLRHKLGFQRGILSIPILVVVLIPSFIFKISISVIIALFVILYCCWFVFYPWFFYQFSSKKIKESMGVGKNGSISYKATVLPEGLELEVNNEKTIKKWGDIQKVVQLEKHLFVQYKQSGGTIIPTRSFETENELEAFVKVFSDHQIEIEA